MEIALVKIYELISKMHTKKIKCNRDVYKVMHIEIFLLVILIQIDILLHKDISIFV